MSSTESDNLPVVHPGTPPDMLEAESSEDAVIVSQWRNSQALAIGNESKGEWLIAPNAYGLDFMR